MSVSNTTEYILSHPDRLKKKDYLSNAPLYINHVTVETSFSPQTAPAHMHIHEFVEISIVTAGKGIHHTLLHTNECNVGDVYFINEGTPHAYFATPGGECPTVCNVIFDPKIMFDCEYAIPDHPKYCYSVFRNNGLFAYLMLTEKELAVVNNTVRCMERELIDRKEDWLPSIKAYLINLCIMAGRYVSLTDTERSEYESKEQLVAQSIMRAVLDHFDEADLTLQKIAKSLFVNKIYAGNIFRAVFGMNFSDYLHQVRLEKAGQMLLDTQLTNEQIVLACGLRDVPNFYRQFKKYTGMTPLVYRKKNQHLVKKSSLSKNKIAKGDINMNNSILIEISENLQKGKAKIVAELVQKALDEGVAPDAILNEGLLSGMNIIGEKFKNSEVYVPEVLVTARAMNKGTAILKPHLAAAGVQATGKVCIGTVQGDLHDIGKNLVKMMLEGKGLEVIDLGTDVSPETFVQTAIDQNCQVICCSALLTTTMGVMEDVVKKAIELGVRDKVKIMIGGAPVNEDFCKKIGADCYTPDAASAADAAVKFCKG